MAKLKQATSDKTTASKTKNETKLNAGKGKDRNDKDNGGRAIANPITT